MTAKLLKLQLLQYMGINEAIHSKDKKKKNNLYLLLGVYILLGIMLAAYMGAGAFGLCMIGAADAVPAYVLSLTSIVILIFTVFKAGDLLFQVKNYEMLITLPIKPVIIVISRFLNMYVGNLVLSAITMLPAGIVYGIYTQADVAFYIMFIGSIFLLPLIPLTIASIIGAVITAIGARMKHKSGVTIAISMIFIIGVLVISFLLPMFGGTEITEKEIADISVMITGQINRIYPPAGIYTEAVVNGNIAAYAVFAGISIGIFAVFAGIVQRKYASICAALMSHAAKNNYVMGIQYQQSPIKAMYIKEIKRYFSSSIYVTNTAIGYIMMIGTAIALLIVGADRIEEAMQLSGIIEIVLPFGLAGMAMMGTTTLCAISIEGKQWWIPKSLPISTKSILGSKILVNLTLGIPSCIIAAAVSIAALGFRGMDSIWLFLLPAAYCLFASILGIAINVKYPQFQWDNEAVVVKQGASLLIGMLLELISVLAGIGIMFVLKKISYNFSMVVLVLIILAAGAAIYKNIIKYDLRKLN